MIVQDDLFEAKLNFFLMVAREVTPFLKLYQTDKPMLPFMSEDLSNILRSLMEKFIKPSVMKNATATVKLLQVDLTDPVNHMDVTKLRVGFVTERGLEEHMKKNSGAERLRLEFRQNCKLFLLKMVSKLFEEAPLKYPLVRNLSVLDPRVLLKSKEVSARKCTTVLRLLVETGRIEEKCCDAIIREFGHFYDHSLMSASDSFRDFNPQSGRLDEFYQEHLSTKQSVVIYGR
ncbi:Malignant fibrous histiocytoma-amplified sequence 1 like [Dissostichus eleginoides]|uniref:Malignant fibrous histiocytoma-amplified sequence 1 like n=1 Tax=Dissostichus eleginoides TaxID=100907 RepID=A0AAD9EQW7_DISEL|nr:Malignant fibrous histiocytoma-amplified sequence 1 like [Dissostichus eleginoides]